jgi:perosamine synthetase
MPMHSRNFRRHPIAEDLAWRGINLPSYPSLTDQEVALISNEIKSFYVALTKNAT